VEAGIYVVFFAESLTIIEIDERILLITKIHEYKN